MDQQLFQTTMLEFVRTTQENFRDIKNDLREFKTEAYKRFDRLETRMDRLEDEVRLDRHKLEEVHQSRNAVKMKFGMMWGVFSLLIAVVASGITQVFGE